MGLQQQTQHTCPSADGLTSASMALLKPGFCFDDLLASSSSKFCKRPYKYWFQLNKSHTSTP
jgi:hypothetical protein